MRPREPRAAHERSSTRRRNTRAARARRKAPAWTIARRTNPPASRSPMGTATGTTCTGPPSPESESGGARRISCTDARTLPLVLTDRAKRTVCSAAQLEVLIYDRQAVRDGVGCLDPDPPRSTHLPPTSQTTVDRRPSTVATENRRSAGNNPGGQPPRALLAVAVRGCIPAPVGADEGYMLNVQRLQSVCALDSDLDRVCPSDTHSQGGNDSMNGRITERATWAEGLLS
ncbi:hypothetical protein BC628DRAFT_1122746 [Trametes gibbosa]|nr:hypothetical protein BC628DRAFT_1122746 [Trametes gibbosa]